MKKEAMFSKLREFGLTTKKAYLDEAFSRNIGLLTQEEQQQLANAKVAIPGMGGVGGVHLITMVRTGVGKFHVSDFDTYEPANINRQFGAKVPDFGRPKLEVMVEQALSINPYLEIKEFPKGIDTANIDAFLDGVQVVLDGLDFFSFDTRRLLFNRAREKGIYVITAGPMGFSGAMIVFSPYDGMTFDEYFNIVEGMTSRDQYLAFGLGLAPRATHIKYMDLSKVDLESKAGPSLNIACQICSGMTATEALRIILKKGKIKPVPHFFQFDPYLQKYRKGYLLGGNRNPIQRTKMWVVKKILAKKKTRPVSAPISPPKLTIEGSKIPDDIIRYLVTMGTWAPSADNCQPWRFTWDGESLSLLKDRSRTGFFYDVNGESTLMTFGAVLENIRIAATHYNLDVSIEISPRALDEDEIAHVKFVPQGFEEEDPLFPFLSQRCVNRRPYNQERIEDDVVKSLQEEVSRFEDPDMIWIEEKSVRKEMKRIIWDADRILFEDHRLYEGLFRWLRMGKDERDALDGMDLDVLELDWFQKRAFPLVASQRILSRLNKVGLSRVMATQSAKLLKASGAYCLLTIRDRSPQAWLQGGMMMERFWIKANAVGLSVQPMAGFVFLLNHLSHDGGVQFRETHMHMIVKMKSSLDRILQDKRSSIPFMLFRVGYAEQPFVRSPRRPIDKLLRCVSHSKANFGPD